MQWREECERVEKEVEHFCSFIQELYDGAANLPSKKEFSNVANGKRYFTLLYSLWDNFYSSVKEFFAVCEEPELLRAWKEFYNSEVTTTKE